MQARARVIQFNARRNDSASHLLRHKRSLDDVTCRFFLIEQIQNTFMMEIVNKLLLRARKHSCAVSKV